MPSIETAVLQYGCGALFINPKTLLSGALRVIGLQDAQIDMKGKTEKAWADKKWPIDVAPSDEEVTLKAGAIAFGLDLYAAKYGEVPATGYTDVSTDEGGPLGIAIPATTFQITVAQAATFIEDLGVFNAATGQQMKMVTSGTPLAGQYKVAAGVYTFSSADNVSGVQVLISYSYGVVGSGRQIVIANRPQGFGPVHEVFLTAPYTSQLSPTSFGNFRLRAARITNIGHPQKRAGYVITPIEMEGFADASGNVMDINSRT